MPIANTLSFNNSGGGGSNPLDPAKYQGLYNASTNTPTLTNGVGTDGYWYLTSAAGSNTPGGVSLAVNQTFIYVLSTGLWTAGAVLSNNTDNIVVGVNYAPVNDTVADGQILSYALGALQYQDTENANNITNNQPMTTLGDLITGGASGTPTRLPGNATAIPKYLKSLGTGSAATAETWTQIAYTDITGTPTGTPNPTPSTLVQRDSNSNFAINAVIQNEDINIIDNAINLTNASAPIQRYKGNNVNPEYILPEASTLRVNQSFEFINQSIGNQSTDALGILNFNGDVIVDFLFPNYKAICTLPSTGTENWNVQIILLMADSDLVGEALYPIGNGINITLTDPTTSTANTSNQTIVNNLNTKITANQPMTTLGDLIIGGASGAPTRLAGNITTTPKFLKSLGNGTTATSETWTQVDYADLSGTPAVGNVVYNPLTNYVPGNFVTYNSYIWLCIANTIGNAPSTSSTVWRQASNVNYIKFATVNIFVGNDTTGNGSYPFATCQAALNYVGNGGAALIYGFEQVYNENLVITGQNQFLGAFGAVQEVGAYHRTLTMASGGSHFSCPNIAFINPVDSPCLDIVTGSLGYGNFYNCNFTISAATPISPAIQFSGTWTGDYYFDSCNIAQAINIGGTPAAAYKIFITNCFSYNNVISINLSCNVEVHINNCKQVNILSHTAGKIFIDGVPYISTLDVSASASANNKLIITNSSMRNPATGAYAIPTGTGTVACQFLNFDYDRGAYNFAGTVIDSDNGFNAINRLSFIAGKLYVLADIVTYGSSLWRCVKPTGTTTQTPSITATDWKLISTYNQEKIAYVDTTLSANYNNVYKTIQAASNAVGTDGTVIILTPNGYSNESVVVNYDYQSWLAVGSLQGATNFTLLGLTDTTPLTLDNRIGFKCQGIEISSVGFSYAISMDNVIGGVFFDKCNINYTDNSDLMVIGGTWDGLIQFNNCKIDGFINSTGGTSPATSQIITNNCRPGDSGDLIIGLDGASLATLYAFDCPSLRVFHNSGKVYLNNIPLIKDSVFVAPAGANNLLSINTCSFYNPTTQTYSAITATGTCDTILQNVNYNRNTTTFAGLIPNGDTIAGIPVATLPGVTVFANMQGFTGSALSPAGYLNLNNGATTFNNITVGTTSVTFLPQTRIYHVIAVIELISNNPGGSSSSLTLTPTVAGGSISINMLPQSISDSANGVHHTLIFNGTINVSNTVSATTFALVITSITGGYSFGTTNSLVINGLTYN